MNDPNDEERWLSQIPAPKPTRIGASKISSLLNRLIQQRGYAAVQSAELLRDAWAEAVGSELANQSRIGRVERGVLQIYVANNIVQTEIEYCKLSAIRILQAKLPDFKIRSIRVRLERP
jgi:hypothetical protein